MTAPLIFRSSDTNCSASDHILAGCMKVILSLVQYAAKKDSNPFEVSSARERTQMLHV